MFHWFLHRGQRISLITALSTDGIVANEVIRGTVNGETFSDSVHGNLIPNMLPFDGENPCFIVNFDN